jgi:hypothetical protein
MEGNDIYILLVFALLCWRRPARPVDDAQLGTPISNKVNLCDHQDVLSSCSSQLLRLSKRLVLAVSSLAQPVLNKE